MISRSRGYLPHLVIPNGTYFITFRLADSLPKELVFRWKQELQYLKTLNKDNSEKLTREYHWRIEKFLDSNKGNCWLNNPKIATIVKSALRYFDGRRYSLHAWTVMPNHVHALLTVFEESTLSSIVYSWKSFTAKQANQVLGITGRFWQPEYFDRVIQSQRQFEFTLRYILNNPVKAGLCKEFQHWPWFGCSAEIIGYVDRFFNWKDESILRGPESRDQ